MKDLPNDLAHATVRAVVLSPILLASGVPWYAVPLAFLSGIVIGLTTELKEFSPQVGPNLTNPEMWAEVSWRDVFGYATGTSGIALLAFFL